MNEVLEQLAAQRVIPVIRSASAADAIATAGACARAGMSVIELTRTVPHVDDAVRTLADDGLVVGVGTITEVAHVDAAVAAGARFVVSYACPPGFAERAAAIGITAMPGGFTPAELLACAATGAPVIKLFPARLAGLDYLRDVRPLLPGVDVIVTGGVRVGDVAAWLSAGALAVGVGGDLGTVASAGASEVERRARAALHAAVAVAGSQ
jgi:2-dehydro-3-deoxyphosphogluconate aldolase/(4S)-4-hydroxy-2-oxoglutarate aldolase